MQEKKIKFTDVLFVGLAFFASYFLSLIHI